MALVHHELCFGCGRTNLFGILLEVEETEPGSVAGRCFIKQDHQGPEPGTAHEGVITAALTDAMAFACGPDTRARAIEVEFLEPAPVGAFVEVAAYARLSAVSAIASSHGRTVARATATYG